MRAGLHDGYAGIVVDRLGVKRADEGDVICDLGDVREQFGDFRAGLAVPRELKLGPHAGELLPGELRDALPLGVAFRHRFAVQVDQLRLVVVEIQLRRRAGLEQINHPLGFRGEVRRVDDAARGESRCDARRLLVLAGREEVRVQKRRERQRAQPAGGAVEEMTAGHGLQMRTVNSSGGGIELVSSQESLESGRCHSFVIVSSRFKSTLAVAVHATSSSSFRFSMRWAAPVVIKSTAAFKFF